MNLNKVQSVFPLQSAQVDPEGSVFRDASSINYFFISSMSAALFYLLYPRKQQQKSEARLENTEATTPCPRPKFHLRRFSFAASYRLGQQTMRHASKPDPDKQKNQTTNKNSNKKIHFGFSAFTAPSLVRTTHVFASASGLDRWRRNARGRF